MMAGEQKRVAVLISGRGSNMAALVEAAKSPGYPAAIVLVVSNRPEAAGLELAARAGVATAVVDHRPHRDDGTAATLSARVLAAEHRIYAQALRLVAEDRVRVVEGRCRIDGVRSADTTLINPPS